MPPVYNMPWNNYRGRVCGNGVAGRCVLPDGHRGGCYVFCDATFAGSRVCSRPRGHDGPHDSVIDEGCELDVTFRKALADEL